MNALRGILSLEKQGLSVVPTHRGRLTSPARQTAMERSPPCLAQGEDAHGILLDLVPV